MHARYTNTSRLDCLDYCTLQQNYMKTAHFDEYGTILISRLVE